MSPVAPLAPAALYRRCTLDNLDFTTTDDLEDSVGFIGQDRAIKSLELGVSLRRQGYNIFVLGPSGAGRHELVRRLVTERAAAEAPPDDWCYVNNFSQPYIPISLRLPAGMGKELQRDMQRLIEDLHTGLSSAFESEEYQTRRRVLEGEFQDRQQEGLTALQEQARQRNLTLLRTPSGLAFAPLRDGDVLPPEEFQKLPEEEQQRIQQEVSALQEQLQRMLLQVPRWEREFRGRLRELNQDVAGLVINDLTGDLLTKYAELADVLDYLRAVQQDVSERLEDFLGDGEEKSDGPPAPPAPGSRHRSSSLRRYMVNVLVEAGDATGAPVVYESNPSYLNLVGRIEQMAMMGALTTDFTLIKPGALHRANGGYLILDALKVLSSPYAWDGLKRALQFGEIRIESPVQMMSLTSTVSLEPEPIDLNVKVILVGDRMVYYLLVQADPEFGDLFKVQADFDDDFTFDAATSTEYARLLGSIVRSRELQPFDRGAICRLIEQASRLVGDSERLTARVQTMVDLLEEADHWARMAGTPVVTAAHVQQAIDGQIYRADRIRSRMQEEVLRETILLDTTGAKVGQINGLAVLGLGTFAFGRPSRITATVHMGKGDVVNIEREVALSGPLHDKGVLILSGYLRSRFAGDEPLALSASLVFEQSYGGVDGDSASSTELYALLSAISRVPIRQGLAVTGSVNQLGEVQAIGGVNEKIEGFFDLCVARGLTGDQGVLIPIANVKHLMLRADVVAAVAEGKFHIYPITHIDEGIEVLTGMPAGQADAEGNFPPETVNGLVAARLAELSAKRRKLDAAARGAGAEGADAS